MALRYIPLSYNHADSQASALRLVLALNPQWEHAAGKIEFVRFTDGITNTVRPGSHLIIQYIANRTQLLKIIRRAPGMSDEDIDREAVLMRAYGNQTEIIIDRASKNLEPILNVRSELLLTSRA